MGFDLLSVAKIILFSSDIVSCEKVIPSRKNVNDMPAHAYQMRKKENEAFFSEIEKGLIHLINAFQRA